MLLPISAMLMMEYSMAAIPELTLKASTPPSRAATRFSSTAFVGLPIRVYMFPSTSKLNRAAPCSALSNSKAIV